MMVTVTPHDLLILSQDFEAYQHLITQANCPGLSIQAYNNPSLAIKDGSQCDLLLGEPSLVAGVLNKLPHVNWVQTTWAGVEPLFAHDIRRNYLLTNARSVYGPMMSEYVFGYLLMIERQIIPRWQSQQAGLWDERPYGTLQGKIMGLLGVGSIGSHLARTARHFGMHVRGYTRLREDCQDVHDYYHANTWAAFAANLDYLVCTLPGTQATRGLVDRPFLSSLPPTAWLVNVGRGSTVDEVALIEALHNHSLAGAVLDVFSQEPLPPGHPLWSTPNTFITSHTAARNYLPDIASLFIENYRRYISAQPLLHQVDFEQGY